MPIRAPAAREVARSILGSFQDDVSDIEVSLAASLIVKAVERDELLQRAHAAETRLVLLDAPDSHGG